MANNDVALVEVVARAISAENWAPRTSAPFLEARFTDPDLNPLYMRQAQAAIAAVTEALSSQDKIREVRADAFEEAAKVALETPWPELATETSEQFACQATSRKIANAIRRLASQKESGQ